MALCKIQFACFFRVALYCTFTIISRKSAVIQGLRSRLNNFKSQSTVRKSAARGAIQRDGVGGSIECQAPRNQLYSRWSRWRCRTALARNWPPLRRSSSARCRWWRHDPAERRTVCFSHADHTRAASSDRRPPFFLTTEPALLKDYLAPHTPAASSVAHTEMLKRDDWLCSLFSRL